MRRLLVLLFAFTLLAASCGGDDGSDDASTDDGTSASGESEGDGADESDDDSEDGDGDGGSEDGAGSGDGDSDGGTDAGDGDEPTGEGIGSDFCDFYDEQQDSSDVDPFATPEELEEAFRDAYDAVDQARRIAPDEIREDMELAYEQYGDFIELMEDSGWDFLAVDQSDPRAQLLESSEVWERLEAYCDDGSDDTAGLPGDGQFDDLEDLFDPEVLQNLDPGDEDAFAVQLFTAMGHDQETAECLVEELGSDFDFESAGADVMSQEFCGLTVLEIFAFGG